MQHLDGYGFQMLQDGHGRFPVFFDRPYLRLQPWMIYCRGTCIWWIHSLLSLRLQIWKLWNVKFRRPTLLVLSRLIERQTTLAERLWTLWRSRCRDWHQIWISRLTMNLLKGCLWSYLFVNGQQMKKSWETLRTGWRAVTMRVPFKFVQGLWTHIPSIACSRSTRTWTCCTFGPKDKLYDATTRNVLKLISTMLVLCRSGCSNLMSRQCRNNAFVCSGFYTRLRVTYRGLCSELGSKSNFSFSLVWKGERTSSDLLNGLSEACFGSGKWDFSELYKWQVSSLVCSAEQLIGLLRVGQCEHAEWRCVHWDPNRLRSTFYNFSHVFWTDCSLGLVGEDRRWCRLGRADLFWHLTPLMWFEADPHDRCWPGRCLKTQTDFFGTWTNVPSQEPNFMSHLLDVR